MSSEEEPEVSGEENVMEDVHEEEKKDERWFVAPDKYVELSVKPANRSATFEAQKNEDTELIFFTFPQSFDLQCLKGQSLVLPVKEHAEVALEGKMKVDSEEEGVTESCVIIPSKAMEYTHVVPIFPTGDASPNAAHWMIGKPFSAGYTVTAAATLKAKPSALSDAMDKKSKAKVRVKRGAKLTAVQEYGVGIKDTILGEETDGNRTIDVVPLESLWSRWTAVGGTKRSREEQLRQAEELAKAISKNAKKSKKAKNEDEEGEDEVAEQPKKKSRKVSKEEDEEEKPKKKHGKKKTK